MRLNWSDWRLASLDDRAACRRLIRQGSRSFFAASLLLSPEIREPAYAVYAFCRLADDGVDGPERRPDAVAHLRRRLNAVYRERPLDYPSDRALADVVSRFDIPQALFEALLDGLDWDDKGRRYETIDDVLAYAARVASAVGAIMTCLMGRRDPETLARACDLGVAMQLTNIARDVGEDARAGRLYLPREWMVAAGIDPDAFLADPVMSPELASVVERLLETADLLYVQSASGIADLPLGCRPAINAARQLYRSIGQVIRENGHDSVSRRAVVSTGRKLPIAARAALEGPLIRRGPEAPPLAATRFLVDATMQERVAGYDSRTEWVIDLFQRLKERDRLRDSGSAA